MKTVDGKIDVYPLDNGVCIVTVDGYNDVTMVRLTVTQVEALVNKLRAESEI